MIVWIGRLTTSACTLLWASTTLSCVLTRACTCICVYVALPPKPSLPLPKRTHINTSTCHAKRNSPRDNGSLPRG